MRRTFTFIVIIICTLGYESFAYAAPDVLHEGTIGTAKPLAFPNHNEVPERFGLYLADLHYEKYILARSLEIYSTLEGDMFVNFDRFVDAIETPIHASGLERAGWIRSPDNTFYLDLSSAQLVANGSKQPPAPGTIYILEGEPYIRTDVLEKWFGLGLSFNMFNQILSISSSEPLPIKERVEREERQQKLDNARKLRNEEATISVENFYSDITSPQIDLTASTGISGRSSKLSSSQSISATVAMDILNNSIYYTGGISTSSGANLNGNQRLTIERTSSLPNTDIIPGVNHYAVGDIYTRQLPTLFSGRAAMGATVGKRDNFNENRTNTAEIVGDAPPGWDVELYRNNSLLEFGKVDSDGRYVFEDIPLYYGRNTFVAKLYSPEGEVRTESFNMWGGGQPLKKGDLTYSLSYLDFTQGFIDPNSAAGRIVSRQAIIGDVKLALSRRLQVGTSIMHTDLQSREDDNKYTNETYIQGNLRYDLPFATVNAAHTQQAGKGSAQYISVIGSLFSQNISVTAERYDKNFDSEKTRSSTSVDKILSASVSARLPWEWLNSYRLEFSYDHQEGVGSKRRTKLTLGGAISKLYWSNTFNRDVSANGRARHDGQFRLSMRIGRFRLRNSFQYSLGQGQFLRSSSTSLSFKFGRNLYNSLVISNNFTGKHTVNVSNDLTYRTKKFGISLSTSSDFESSWSATIRLTTSIYFEDRVNNQGTGSYLVSQPQARSARVWLEFFLDDNGNGHQDSNEVPLEGIRYNSNKSGSPSDKNGIIRLRNIPASSPHIIMSKNLELGDPFLAVATNSFKVFAHSGGITKVKIPVITTATIEGLVTKKSPLGLSPFVGKYVHLLAQGEVIQTVQVQFDGYYSFAGIPTNKRYIVRVDAPSPSGQNTEMPINLDQSDYFEVPEIIVDTTTNF